MKPKTALNILATLAAAASIASCGSSPTLEEIASEPTAVLPSPILETEGLSKYNNPFINSFEYDVSTSFSMLTEPVDDFRGTVVESYLYELELTKGGSGDYSSSNGRPIGVLVVRDPQNKLYYFIYPAEKIFPQGERISISRFWALREDLPLMNNMLGWMITSQNNELDGNYPMRQDFPIESPAEDGHFDGIIELGAVRYISPEVDK